MSFKSFQLKVNPRANAKPVSKERKYLPNGFYVGQRVFYLSINGQEKCYGTVVEITQRLPGYSFENNIILVWADWDNGSHPGYIPRDKVYSA